MQSEQKIGTCVPFVQLAKDFIIERLDGAGDEKTPSFREFWQRIRVAKQVFDFDGYVVRELRKLPMQVLDDADSVSNAVEKVWISKRDVLRTGSDLLANIGEN